MVRGKGVSGCAPTAHCGPGRPTVRVHESRARPALQDAHEARHRKLGSRQDKLLTLVYKSRGPTRPSRRARPLGAADGARYGAGFSRREIHFHRDLLPDPVSGPHLVSREVFRCPEMRRTRR